jgi:hypothetical protein
MNALCKHIITRLELKPYHIYKFGKYADRG